MQLNLTLLLADVDILLGLFLLIKKKLSLGLSALMAILFFLIIELLAVNFINVFSSS